MMLLPQRGPHVLRVLGTSGLSDNLRDVAFRQKGRRQTGHSSRIMFGARPACSKHLAEQ